MDIKEKIEGIYRGVEEKFYSFVDWLDGKGVSLYPVIETLENNNLPALPVFAAIFLLLVGGIGYLFLFSAQTITITVLDEAGNALLNDANVTIEFLVNGERQSLDGTTKEGKVSFSVPRSNTYNIIAYKTGYAKKETTATGNTEITLKKESQTITKTISILAEEGGLFDKEITLTFSCSTGNFRMAKTIESGKVILDIPKDCGNLQFEAPPNYTTSSFTGIPNEITIKETVQTTGKLMIKTEANASVKLYSSANLTGYPGVTGDNGNVLIEAPKGEYYATVSAPGFAFYNNTSRKFTITENQTTNATINLTKANEQTMSIIVKDKDNGEFIENAEIIIRQDNMEVESKETDDKGEVVFLLEERQEYDLDIFKAGYIRYTTTAEAKDSLVVYLQEITSVNSGDLEIQIVDTRGKIVQGAIAILKKTGTIVGKPLTSGTNGKVIFRNLGIDTYTISVSKAGYAKKEQTIILNPSNPTAKIVLDIAYKTFQIKTISEGELILGAKITAYSKDEQLDSDVTDETGTANLSIRSDLEPYFVIEHDDYLKQTTTASEEDNRTIELIEGVSSITVDFLGLYKGEESIETPTQGEKYTAKFRLVIPENETFTEAGLFVMTGNSEQKQTNIMDYDSAYIGNIRAGNASFIRGTSYSPPKGYSIDQQNLTTGKSKFVLFKWNSNSDVYEAEVEINTKTGEELIINYRGYAKGDSYLRFPYDAILGNSADSSYKQSLYSAVKTRSYSLGFENICDSGFCRSFYIKDYATDLKENVYNEYTVLSDTDYELDFVLNYRNEKAYNAVNLKIDSFFGNLQIKEYEIRLPNGETKTGNGKINLLISSLDKDSYISGKIIFRAKDEVEDSFTITIDKLDELIFEKTLGILVEEKQELDISLLPKEIVPLINNNLLIKTKTEAGSVEKATIIITSNGERIYSGLTNSEGILKYELQAPSLGTKIKIKAEKTGYKETEIEIKVDRDLLEQVPEKFQETISKEKTIINTSMTLTNNSPIDLTIKDITTRGLNSDYFSVSYEDEILGEILEPGDSTTLEISIRIKEKGLKVEEVKEFTGEIIVITRNDDEGYEFEDIIETKVKIGLGGEVDETDCLILTPVSWKISTIPNKEKELLLRIKNNCSVNDMKIPIGEIQIRTDLKKEIGTLYLDNKVVQSTYTTAIESLDAGEETEFTLKFNGNIGTVSDAKIKVMSKNFFATDTEEIVSELKLELNIDDLAECLLINSPETIELETAPTNTGYNQYANYGYNNYTNMGLSNGYSTSGYSNGVYPNYANTSSSQYYDSSYNNNWNYGLGERSIQINNTCKQKLEIQLETTGAIKTNKTKLSLNKGQTDTITLESGYRMGTYELVINIVTEGEDKVEVKRIPVRVKRADELGENCITLSSKKISLTSIIGAPQKVNVYNNCYDNGFRLANDAAEIDLKCFIPTGQKTSLSTKQPAIATGQTVANQATQLYMINPQTGQLVTVPIAQTNQYTTNGYTQSGYVGRQTAELKASDCPLVNQLTIGETNIRSTADKTIEKMEIRFYPNLTYRKYMCELSARAPGEEIFKIRQTLAGTLASISADGTLALPYSYYSGSSKKVFSVQVQDFYQLAGTIDECLENYGYLKSEEEYRKEITIGNPLTKGYECVKAKYPTQTLDLSKAYGSDITIDSDATITIKDIEMIMINDKLCGGSDIVTPTGFITKNDITKLPVLKANGFEITITQSKKKPYMVDIRIKAPYNEAELDLSLLGAQAWFDIKRNHPQNKETTSYGLNLAGKIKTLGGYSPTKVLVDSSVFLDSDTGIITDTSSALNLDKIDYTYDTKPTEIPDKFCEHAFCTEEQFKQYLINEQKAIIKEAEELAKANTDDKTSRYIPEYCKELPADGTLDEKWARACSLSATLLNYGNDKYSAIVPAKEITYTDDELKKCEDATKYDIVKLEKGESELINNILGQTKIKTEFSAEYPFEVYATMLPTPVSTSTTSATEPDYDSYKEVKKNQITNKDVKNGEVKGTAGNDLISVSKTTILKTKDKTGYKIYGNGGQDEIYGTNYNDEIRADGKSIIWGNKGSDIIYAKDSIVLMNLEDGPDVYVQAKQIHIVLEPGRKDIKLKIQEVSKNYTTTDPNTGVIVKVGTGIPERAYKISYLETINRKETETVLITRGEIKFLHIIADYQIIKDKEYDDSRKTYTKEFNFYYGKKFSLPNTSQTETTLIAIGSNSGNDKFTEGEYIYDFGGNADIGSPENNCKAIYGGDGDDKIALRMQNICAYGENGDDLIVGSGYRAWIYGGKGNDKLISSNVDDLIYGEDGDDKIIGGKGTISYSGGDGDDTITEAYANNRYIGGDDGDDTVEINMMLLAEINNQLIIDGGNGKDVLNIKGPENANLTISIENIVIGKNDEGEDIRAETFLITANIEEKKVLQARITGFEEIQYNGKKHNNMMGVITGSTEVKEPVNIEEGDYYVSLSVLEAYKKALDAKEGTEIDYNCGIKIKYANNQIVITKDNQTSFININKSRVLSTINNVLKRNQKYEGYLVFNEKDIGTMPEESIAYNESARGFIDRLWAEKTAYIRGTYTIAKKDIIEINNASPKITINNDIEITGPAQIKIKTIEVKENEMKVKTSLVGTYDSVFAYYTNKGKVFYTEGTTIPDKDLNSNIIFTANKEGIDFNPTYLAEIVITNPNNKQASVTLYGTNNKEISQLTIEANSKRRIYTMFDVKETINLYAKDQVEKDLSVTTRLIYLNTEGNLQEKTEKIQEFNSTNIVQLTSLSESEINKSVLSYLMQLSGNNVLLKKNKDKSISLSWNLALINDTLIGTIKEDDKQAISGLKEEVKIIPGTQPADAANPDDSPPLPTNGIAENKKKPDDSLTPPTNGIAAINLKYSNTYSFTIINKSDMSIKIGSDDVQSNGNTTFPNSEKTKEIEISKGIALTKINQKIETNEESLTKKYISYYEANLANKADLENLYFENTTEKYYKIETAKENSEWKTLLNKQISDDGEFGYLDKYNDTYLNISPGILNIEHEGEEVFVAYKYKSTKKEGYITKLKENIDKFKIDAYYEVLSYDKQYKLLLINPKIFFCMSIPYGKIAEDWIGTDIDSANCEGRKVEVDEDLPEDRTITINDGLDIVMIGQEFNQLNENYLFVRKNYYGLQTSSSIETINLEYEDGWTK